MNFTPWKGAGLMRYEETLVVRCTFDTEDKTTRVFRVVPSGEPVQPGRVAVNVFVDEQWLDRVVVSARTSLAETIMRAIRHAYQRRQLPPSIPAGVPISSCRIVGET